MRKFIAIFFSLLFLLLLDSCRLVQFANIEKRHYRSGFYIEKSIPSNNPTAEQTKIKLEEKVEPLRSLEFIDSICFSKDTFIHTLTASLQTHSFTKKQIRPTKISTIVGIRKDFIKSKNKEITDKKLRKKNRIKDKSDWETFWLVLGMILAYSILIGLIFLVALAWLALFSGMLLLVAILLSILSLFILFALLYLLSYIISPRVC